MKGNKSILKGLELFASATLCFLFFSKQLTAQINPTTAITFIKNQYLINSACPCSFPTVVNCPLKRKYVVSYDSGIPGLLGGACGVGFTYDNALAVLSLVHHGQQGTAASNIDSLNIAEGILLNMATYWQSNIGGVNVGNFYEAYQVNGPAPAHLNQPVGSAAWFTIAALNFLRLGGNGNSVNNATIEASALATLNWINGFYVLNPSGLSGFLWGINVNTSGLPAICSAFTVNSATTFNVMSTEQHSAIFAAASLAHARTGLAVYKTMADKARSFILSAWQPGITPSVGTGTFCGNSAFDLANVGTDAYFLPVLAMQNNFLVPGDPLSRRWADSFTNINSIATATAHIGATTFTGYDFSTPHSLIPGIHPEISALAFLSKTATANASAPTLASLASTLLATQISAAGTTPGSSTGEGVVTAFTDSPPSGGNPPELPTVYGFSFWGVRGIAATVWSYFAAQGVNPYYLEPALAGKVIFGQDLLGFGVVTAPHPSGGTSYTFSVNSNYSCNGLCPTIFFLITYSPGNMFTAPMSFIDPALGGYTIERSTVGLPTTPVLISNVVGGASFLSPSFNQFTFVVPNAPIGQSYTFQAVTVLGSPAGVTVLEISNPVSVPF